MSSSPSSSQLQNPRAVLTSLINHLTRAPQQPLPNTSTIENNALKSIPQSHRPLLVTLHVLFPSIVLPALDLLDRNLVTRVVKNDTEATSDVDPEDPAITDLAEEEEESSDFQTSPHSYPDQNEEEEEEEEEEDRGAGRMTAGSNGCEPAAFYLVRSVASTMSRRKKAEADSGSSSATTKYLVHLDAWSCTCANFAFEAFPARGEQEIGIMSADVEVMDEASPEWQFGGLSFDGIDHGAVPCCKHLLACLLAERWRSVLANYVTESRMSRAAIAGTVGDI